MINKKLVYIICSFTAIAIVGSIFSNNVMADDVNYDVTVAPSIMVSIPTDTVTLNLNPFVSTFGSTDLPVTVGTNNSTGYTLTMSPSDDTTTSLTRTGGTETIPTLDDLSGGYTEQTFTTNKWGYKLSSTNYLPFATSNEIAVTDAPTNATTSTVTFATKADTTLVSGAYNLEITFTAVANPIPEPTGTPGYITYNPNANDVVGEMGDQAANDGDDVILYVPNFKRSGYGFSGWNTKPNGTGVYYGPNGVITAPEGVTANGLILYAIWTPSAGNLQNWTCPNDTTMPKGTVTALTDTRDNNTYSVAKLADGKCWMIENLRLADKDSNGNDIILSNSNTNNPRLPLMNTDGNTSNHLSPTTDPFQTAWCGDSTAACIDKSMLATNNTTLFIDNVASNYQSEDADVYGYGNYYNWYSATAGNGTYDTNTDNSNTSGDICPTGWRLPTGGDDDDITDGDFGNLIVSIVGAKPAGGYYVYPDNANAVKLFRSYPNNFIASGGAATDRILSRGGGWFGLSIYWTRTVHDSDNAYYLWAAIGDITFGEQKHDKSNGATIRCISNS